MKTANLVRPIPLIALALLAVARPAQADLLAYEPFDYSAGGDLSKAPVSGSGFDGDWQFEAADGTVAEGSLVPTGDSTRLEAIGNSVEITANSRVGIQIDTTLPQFAPYVDQDGNLGAEDTTLYMSFLLQPDGATKSWALRTSREVLGDGGMQWLVGNDRPGPEGRPSLWNLWNCCDHLKFVGDEDATTDAEFYVVRMDFLAGLDEVRVYRNPPLGSEPKTPDAEDLDYPKISFDTVQLQAFIPGRVLGVDEIRIGETYADVTPLTGDFNGNGIQITDVVYNPVGPELTITWTSRVGKTYKIESSQDLDLEPWIEEIDSFPPAGATSDRTSFTLTSIPPDATKLFLRVAEQE
jgi:hypothetical protein